jgi:nucleotide-binding universal stress UspA family protein
VDEGISEFAEKNNIDLIITLPKKHSVLERLFEKSTTRELIHQTKIPMMCIHQEVHEEAAKTQPS